MYEILIFGMIILVGLALGRYLKHATQKTYKGPSSNSVRNQVFSDEEGDYRLVPDIYICPSYIDPEDFSHSDSSD